MRVLIGLCAALLLATGCSRTDDGADRETTDQTAPGAPGDVTGGATDTPPADTTTPSDPSTMPPSDQTTPPATDETTPPPPNQ
jgi:hypothetical protein